MIDRVEYLKSDKFDEAEKIGNAHRVLQGHDEIVRLVKDRADLTEALDNVMLNSLECIVSDNGSIQNMENFKLYLRLLYKMRKIVDMVKASLRMHSVFPGDNVPLEWACKVFVEWSAGETLFDPELKDLFASMPSLIDKLLAINSSSALALVASGVSAFQAGNVRQAEAQLTAQLMNKETTNLFGILVLCQCLLKLGHEANLEKCIEKAQLLLYRVKDEKSRSRIEEKLSGMLMECFCRQSKYERAKHLLPKEFVKGDPLLVKAAIIYAHLNDIPKVEQLLAQMQSNSDEKLFVQALVAKSEGRMEQCLSILVGMNQDTCDSRLLMGQVLWENLERREESLAHFLMAAKLNSANWLPFYHLGNFYQMDGPKQDLDKAIKCLLKALSLNPSSSLAGSALSDIYRQLERFQENLEFLKSVTASGEGPDRVWAHLRLGMNHFATHEYGKAIVSFYSVLRTQPNNPDAWESLADAYHARGSFQAALKAYEKVVSLLDGCPHDGSYAKLQIATIHFKTGHYDSAIRTLEEILKIDKDGNAANT